MQADGRGPDTRDGDPRRCHGALTRAVDFAVAGPGGAFEAPLPVSGRGNPMALDYPHLEFTEAFWWTRPEGRRLRLGITRAAAEGLTYVTHVDLVAVGATFHSGQPVGTIESQKVVSDLFAPLSGRVVEHNPALRDRPFLVNSDPEGEGWLLLVERLDANHGSEEVG